MDERTRKSMASSERDSWGTPQKFFNAMSKFFGGFSLDVCASPDNTKCERFYTKEEDGLKQSWENEKIFCNPPYGHEPPKWLKKGYEESQKDNLDKVFLVAARTDTEWFVEAASKAACIFFIKGRLTFEGGPGTPAFFPSAVIVFNSLMEGKSTVRWVDRNFECAW
jgi:site-specific DNA-methyltransferase (adenine-specific)